jgi:YegS/Rv2252/BmrU family lipid kinase
VSRRLALLVNPFSAGGKPLAVLPAVTAELGRIRAEYRVVETRSLEHAREEAEIAAESGETVGALGGDGFLRPLAAVLRGRDTALAVLPGGRGNDFARVLGIPSDPAAAARVAATGEERLVDLAYVDGTPYVGIASLGFDSEANRIANQTKWFRGDAVYLYAGLRTLAGWKPARFSVAVDGERHEATGYLVAVGNSKAYGGGIFLLPHAELDDGQLDVLIAERHSKLRWLRRLPKVFKGKHLPDPDLHLLRGAVVEVSSDPPFEVYADGDPICTTPATMRVEPRCLRVVVPAS